MVRDRQPNGNPPDAIISIIGPGMRVVGDCETEGTVRIEGTVEGSVRAGKAVVVGKDGLVEGDIFTQDAVISGRVKGTLIAESRLELQATSRVDGEVHARRMQLEEGALLNGTVHMGEIKKKVPELPPPSSPRPSLAPPSPPSGGEAKVPQPSGEGKKAELPK